MRVITKLLKHEAVLSQARPASFLRSFFQPTVKGKFKNYHADFGVVYQKHGGKVFYRLQLSERINVPFFLWNECPIDGYRDIMLCFERWVTIYEYPFTSIKKYFDSQNNDKIKERFLKLAEIARKIQNKDIRFDKVIKKEKKDFMKGILVAAIAAVIVIPLVYWWLYH